MQSVTEYCNNGRFKLNILLQHSRGCHAPLVHAFYSAVSFYLESDKLEMALPMTAKAAKKVLGESFSTLAHSSHRQRYSYLFSNAFQIHGAVVSV